MSPSLASVRRTTDLLDTPITLLDLEGRILHLNPANERRLGRTADELRGQPIGAIFPDELRERSAEYLASLLEHGTLRRMFANERPDGTVIQAEVTAKVLPAANGEPGWILVEVRDLGPEIAQLEQLNASVLSLLTAPGDDLLVEIVRVARELLGARYAALGIIEDGDLVRFIPDGMSETQIAGIAHWPQNKGLLGAMIAERRTIRTPEIRSDPRSSGFPTGHPPMRPFLGTPIQTADALYGYLWFTEKLESPEFSFVDERLAEIFASHAAIAIRDRQRSDELELAGRNLAEAQRIAHIGSWERDLATGTLRWSDESHRIFGIEPGTFAGTLEAFLAFVHPDDRAKAAPSRAALEEGPPPPTEYRIVRADGTVRILREFSDIIRDAAGSPIRFVGSTQDITRERELEAQQKRFARLLDELASEIYVFEAETLRFTQANAGAQRNLGYSIDELCELTPVDLKPEYTRAWYEMLLAPLVAGERNQITFETIQRRKDGSTYPIEGRVHFLPNETPPVFVSIIEDITERLATEERLRESERNLTEAQRIAHIGSWEWDIAGDTNRWSDEALHIFGLERASFIGSNAAFLALIHPDDVERVREADRVALKDGVPYDVTHRIVRPDGAVMTVHELGEVIRAPDGTPLRMIGTTQDVTERVAAEEERTRLVSAVEQTADSIVIHNLDGTMSYVNPSFARLYGYAPEEVIGRHARILESGHHEAAFWAELWASVNAGHTWIGAIVNRRKDGSLLEVDSVISPVLDTRGHPVNFVQTDRDVTRERELEGALERDARERETIEAALERIEAGSSPEAIAAAACAEIVRLPGIDSAWVLDLAKDHGRLLAVVGPAAGVLPPGQPIPEARSDYLRERASAGPWAEVWRPRPEDGTYGEAISATGLQILACAPLKGDHGVVGVIGVGANDPANRDLIVERLPALATFGSIIGALIAPTIEARHRETDALAIIQAIIDAGAFTPFFQPIVELGTGAVLGYEALTRFADGQRPDLAFAAAAEAGLGIELEVATITAAIEAATAALPPVAYLSLNVSPELVLSGHLGQLLAGQTRPIVLEITEHVAIDDYAELRRELSAFGPTVGVAVDDAGAGYASFRHILELAPQEVKLDIGLVRGIDADPARQALIAGMSYFAVKRKIHLIAEGVETHKELGTLRSLGVHFGQGYLLGRPQDGRGPGPWPRWVALAGSSSEPRLEGPGPDGVSTPPGPTG